MRFSLDEERKKFLLKLGIAENDASYHPESVDDGALIAKMMYLGKCIKSSSRRFIAILPELDKRQLCLKLKHDSTADMALAVAGLSPRVVSRVLRTAKYLEPFEDLKKLFVQSNIGWTKFETIGPALTADNAESFLWHLQNNTTKRSLKIITKNILARKKEADAAGPPPLRSETESVNSQRLKGINRAGMGQNQSNGAAPEGTTSTSQASTDSANGSERGKNPASVNKTVGQEQATLLDFFKLDTADINGASTCSCTCGCNHKKGVGQIFYVAGKAAVNITLYAQVAEALFQRADMLEQSKSKIADLSKVIEGLLYSNVELSNQYLGNEADSSLAKVDNVALTGKPLGDSRQSSSDSDCYKVKREREVIVVTYDKEKDLFSSRSRNGDFEVEAKEAKAIAKNGDDPLDLNDLREQAINCASKYMLKRFALGKELTRYIPKLVKDFLFYRSKGYFCEFPGCSCRGFGVHHLDRYSIKNGCHPDRLVVLCLEHHDLAHDGALGGEDGPISGLHIDVGLAVRRNDEGSEIAKVDALYRKMRTAAARNRYQPEAI